MKRIATWLLTLLLVANVVAGCGGGLAGQGRQDRFGGPQPAASLLDGTQGEQKEQPLGAVQETTIRPLNDHIEKQGDGS